MKINVTYEGSDIEALVRKDLAAKGLDGEALIRFEGGQVLVTIEGVLDESAVVPPSPLEPSRAAPTSTVDPAPAGDDEGAVDMTDVLGLSHTVAHRSRGLYPAPDRKLMDGESHDLPGGRR